MDSLTLTLFAIVAILLAGTVKGAVGLGLPTTALGLLTLAIDPRTAIALVLIPMFVSNVWQLYRAGHVRRTLKRYAIFAGTLVVVAAVTLALTAGVPERLLLAVLGMLMLVYSAISLTRWAPEIPERLDRWGQGIAGAISGLFGGLVGIWAPPMAVYLAARKATKDEFVRASGLILGIGSLPLILGYVREGFLTRDLIFASILLLIPTFAGFALGERMRGWMSEEGFRRAILIFFALMGLNLLRRAIW